MIHRSDLITRKQFPFSYEYVDFYDRDRDEIPEPLSFLLCEIFQALPRKPPHRQTADIRKQNGYRRRDRVGRLHRPGASRASGLDEDALGQSVDGTKNKPILALAQQINRLVMVEHRIWREEPIMSRVSS